MNFERTEVREINGQTFTFGKEVGYGLWSVGRADVIHDVRFTTLERALDYAKAYKEVIPETVIPDWSPSPILPTASIPELIPKTSKFKEVLKEVSVE